MALPALRRPKLSEKHQAKSKKFIPTDIQFVILTLKNNNKLVVTSDAYHGILTTGEMYKCVFCGTEMELNEVNKDLHKDTATHKKLLESYPHLEEYSENLIRKVTKDNAYCTLCNVQLSVTVVSRHISTESHINELQRAATRSAVYKATK